MDLLANLQLLSQYNSWMNQKVYQAAQQLDEEQIKQDQGAFFGSIFATLNHIYVADIIWLKRFSRHSENYLSLNDLPPIPSYTVLNEIVTESFIDLWQLRQNLDNLIINWCLEITLKDLTHNLTYTNTKGDKYCKNFGQLVQHFFNHQTHHRGQISTLLSQQGINIGVTDLLDIIPSQI
ncbi:hypothetical protein NIES4102_05030 [Chondrocystis sp. NIES-4102]|nr:hypothetical protein NIES4102_05030 [Chondrocystis sp. NIES-4102]